MSLPNNVIRSSSLPDVKDIGEAGLLRTSKPLPSSFSPDVDEDYVVFGGQQLRVRKSFAISVDSAESGEKEHSPRASLKSPKNRLLQLAQNETGGPSRRSLGIEQFRSDANALVQCETVGSEFPRPLSSRNQRMVALTAKVAELDALVSEVSPNKAGNGCQKEYSYKTPTAASTSVVDQGKPLRHFFPSPASDTATPVEESESVLLGTPGTMQRGGDVLAFSITAESFKLDGPKTTGKKKGPPPSLAQRLAMGSADRRKLHSTHGGKASGGGPGEEAQHTVGTSGQAAEPAASSSSSSSLARKLSSARAHPYPTAPSPTKDGSRVSPSLEVLAVGPQGGLSLLSPGSSVVPVVMPVPVSFHWQQRKAELAAAGQQAVFLFVAHDNPQLGKTVSSQLGDQGVSSSSTSTSGSGGGGMKGGSSQKTKAGGGARRMLCMLECKDKASPVNTHFILGRIVYSGDYAGIEGAEAQQPRGSACLVVTELSAVRGDLKQLATRAREDIIEVDLANTPPGFSVPIRSEEDLRALLRPCVAHVDVILDPYHTSLQWFPYWEGARRMAPQFRSKGIGYLRLGDDMSQYGTAFLSLDAGHTYLDGGATTIVSHSAATPIHGALPGSLLLSRTFSGSGASGGVGLPGSSGSGAATPKLASTTGSVKLRLTRALSFEKGAASADSPTFDERENVPGNLAQDGRIPTGKTPFRSPRGGAADQAGAAKKSPRGTASAAQPSPGNSSSSGGGAGGALRKAGSSSSMKVSARECPQWEVCTSALRDCVIAIKGGDGMKWAERVDALQRLAAALSSVSRMPSAEAFVSANATLLSEAVTLVGDSLAKQSNPHVLVACLACVRAMECGALLTVYCWLAWRGLLLEAAYALRGANRMVHEAALAALTHLCSAEVAGITTATLCTGGLVEDIAVGARSSGGAGGNAKKGIGRAGSSSARPHEGSGSTAAGGGAGSVATAPGGKVATAANTARVLNWLSAVVVSEYEQAVQRCAGGSAPFAAGMDLSGMLRCAVALLSHREEGTREAAVELIVSALASDMIGGAAAQGGVAQVFALSKALSGDLLQVPGASVKANTDAAERMQTAERALSPPVLPLLAEVKAVHPRFLERILQQLAQAVSRVCLEAAVTATAAAQRPATGREDVVAAPPSARTVSSDATLTLAGAFATSSASPRGLSLSPRPNTATKANSASAAPATKKVTLLDNRPALVREDSGLTDVSNASTPPYQYLAGDARSQRTPLGTPRHDFAGTGTGTTAGDRSTFSSLAAADDTPGPGAGSILRSQSAKSPATISPSADLERGLELDEQKMQQGLQGIKMMRARSANAGSTRAVGVATDTAEGGTVSVGGTASRAGSACRSSRRRILQPGSSAVATGSSPTPGRDTTSPQAGMDSAATARVAQQLGGMWYEAKLLLRQVPRDQTEWETVRRIISEAPVFFADLAALSAQTRFPKGAILRQVLPFDEHTSSNDQAKGRVLTVAGGDVSDSYFVALPAALQGHEATLQRLAERAVGLRGAIRVKMADEADVTQASAAVEVLGKFCSRLGAEAGVTGLAPMQLIRQLESAS